MSYKEKQSFKDVSVLVLLSAGIVAAAFGIVNSFQGDRFLIGNAVVCSMLILLFAGGMWWLRQLKLKVSVNDKRIKFKLSPIQDKSERIQWEEVESCRIVKTPFYAPVQWRTNRLGRESWFSLNGRNGLAITTKDGKQYFIGVSNVDQLEDTISQISMG